MKNTVYVRPPDRRLSGPKSARAPKGPVREVSGGLFRYRVQLAPILLAFFLGTWTMIMEGLGDRFEPRLKWIIPVVLVSVASWVWFLGIEKPLSGPDTRRKRVERIYGLAVIVLALAWNRLITFDATVSLTLKWYAVLALATYPVAAPWLWHRRIRGSIAIHFDPRIPFKIRRPMEARARTVIHDWDGFTRASAAAGSTLRAINYDPVSVELDVRLGHARVAEDFTDLRLRRLESAFEARRGSARVTGVQGKSARLVKIRFMLSDPLAESLIASEADVTDPDEMTLDIGIFETGGKVIIDLVHTLIAGASGAGKSGVINAIMRALVRKPKVAIVGIDMKPGGLELGKWADAMVALATNPEEAKILLTEIIRGIHRRGAIMKERGIRKWIPTEEEPFIVLMIDEAAQLKKAGLGNLLVIVSELARAYGFAMFMATQHPTDKSISTEAVANCLQRIGLACEANTAERLIFGDDATKDGWRLSSRHLPNEGMFRVKSKRYRVANIGRAYWMDDQTVDVDVARYAPAHTGIDAGTWNAGTLGARTRPAIEPEEEEEGTTVTVIVEDSPEEGVFMAVCGGVGVPKQIADHLGMPLRTVQHHLKALSGKGMIRLTDPGARASIRNPWRRA